jgi:long-chain fatty acid transport protein
VLVAALVAGCAEYFGRALAAPAASVGFNATVPLPASVTASVRQKITDSFTLLGTVEWTEWSRLGTIPVITSAVAPGIPTQLPFEWRNSWMVSGGAEYQWGPRLALRAGVAWEESPITDQTRATRLPDAERMWVSAGATYKCSEQLGLEVAYSHIFIKDAPINLSPGSGNPTFNAGLGTFIGTASSEVDIVSVGLRYRFLPPRPPVIRKG